MPHKREQSLLLARQALACYEESDDHPQCALTDLLSDLRHLATDLGIDFDRSNANSTRHHEIETWERSWP